MTTSRRDILKLAAGATLFAPAVHAQTGDYPSRPITIVVPFQPGGTNDILARAVAQRMTETMRVSVVVDNRPGASGNLGAQLVAQARPDGYTIMTAPVSVLAINRWLFNNLAFDVDRDLAPLSNGGAVPNALIVNPAVQAQTIQELVAFARANPGRLNFASMGSGTTGHLCGEMFKRAANIDIVHVPYRGSAPALNDLLSGQVQMMFDNLPTALPNLRANRLRGLAVTSRERHPTAPNLPTMVEAGLDVVATAWFGFVAPARTPEPILDRLNREIVAALNDPPTRERLEAAGVTVIGDTRAQFTAFIAAEAAKWQRVVRESGARLDE